MGDDAPDSSGEDGSGAAGPLRCTESTMYMHCLIHMPSLSSKHFRMFEGLSRSPFLWHSQEEQKEGRPLCE